MIWLDFLLFWLSLRSNVIPASIPRLGYKIMWFSIIAANAAQQVFRGARETWCEFFTPRSSTWRLRHFGTRACDSMPTGARQSTNQKLCNFNSDFFFFVLRNYFHLHAGDKSEFDLNFLCGIWARGNSFFFLYWKNIRCYIFYTMDLKLIKTHDLNRDSHFSFVPTRYFNFLKKKTISWMCAFSCLTHAKSSYC